MFAPHLPTVGRVASKLVERVATGVAGQAFAAVHILELVVRATVRVCVDKNPLPCLVGSASAAPLLRRSAISRGPVLDFDTLLAVKCDDSDAPADCLDLEAFSKVTRAFDKSPVW
jgi:hypothetical protein